MSRTLSFLPSTQLLVLPAVAALIGIIVLFTVSRNKKSVLVVLLIGSILSFGQYVFVHLCVPSSPLLVSLFADEDAYGGQSRILAKKLSYSIGLDGPAVSTLAQEVKDSDDARKLLLSPKLVGGSLIGYQNFGDSPEKPRIAVIWGSKRWLRITFSGLTSQALFSPATDTAQASWLAKLRLVTGVPEIGLRFEHSGSSILFLRDLFRGIWFATDSLEPNTPKAIVALDGATKWVGSWSTGAHQALPALLLGNISLKVASDPLKLTDMQLNCIYRHYKNGLARFQLADNPALFFALRNNLGLINLLRWMRASPTISYKQVVKSFSLKLAKPYRNDPNIAPVIAILKQNLRYIRNRNQNQML